MDKNIVVYRRNVSFSRQRFVIGTTMALAGLTAALGTAAVGYGAYSGISAMSGGGAKAPAKPSMPGLPSAPTAAAATEAEKARIRKKTKTILTGPLTGGDYGTAAPTLLGSGDVTKKQVLG